MMMSRFSRDLAFATVAFLAMVYWTRPLNASEKSTSELAELSLEELMNESVTSVSKKEAKVSESAAAIFVISQEDIRRSGMTSIPELLRMVPGVQVARIDGNKWAISARGFGHRFANKLLVLIDGRTIYTHAFSGVYWDGEDVVLEDVERIEVIRGPGATLWGANAVNGVINIITKRAQDTRGGLLSVSSGSEELGLSTLRYGGRLGTKGFYRGYGKYFYRDNQASAAGREAADAWDALRSGFRMDLDLNKQNALTVQGDEYDGDLGQTLGMPVLRPPFLSIVNDRRHNSGGNLLTRWNHQFSNRSDLELQAYYSRASRSDMTVAEKDAVLDFDLSQHRAIGGRHEIVWGLGYRSIRHNQIDGRLISFRPDHRTDAIFSTFLQDEISLVPQRLRLTLGSKFEHNSYSGFEPQPNGRLLWTPGLRQTVWAAVSQAARTPSRFEADGMTDLAVTPRPGGIPVLTSVFGSHSYASEKLFAYELGYRAQPKKGLSIDLAGFYNVYRNQRSLEPGTLLLEPSPAPVHLLNPLVFGNGLHGEGYGFETVLNWNAFHSWSLRPSYSFLQVDFRRNPGSRDQIGMGVEIASPKHQAQLTSLLRLRRNIELDSFAAFVGRVRVTIPSYIRVDTRLGWRWSDNLELSLGGQNLLRSQHPEYTPFSAERVTEPERSIYGRMLWRF